MLVIILSQEAETLQDLQKELQMEVASLRGDHWLTSLAPRTSSRNNTWVNNARFDNCPGQD
jgi:hypothetical protein